MEHERLDLVFGALADRSRRRMLDAIEAKPGCLTREIAEGFEISRIAVMRHLKVLEAAGLVTSEKVGRERRHYFNAAPIQMVRDEWMERYCSFWSERMADVKRRLESDGQQEAARDVS
ncbi:MAG: helix-turn-helix transcriptional regulator [Phycisphaerales bacterium]|nr:helix-turn-helix transcriptional regulator [Phycisphaerales bacterium]